MAVSTASQYCETTKSSQNFYGKNHQSKTIRSPNRQKVIAFAEDNTLSPKAHSVHSLIWCLEECQKFAGHAINYEKTNLQRKINKKCLQCQKIFSTKR